MLKTFLNTLRKKHDYTQEQVSEVIGVTRQTYSIIESNKQELSISQAQKLAQLYGISIEDIIYKKDTTPKIKLPSQNKKPNASQISPQIRIDVPQNKIDIFKEVLIYILNKVGAKQNIGMTVLYKLLYFIDFDYYEKYEKQLMGLEYTKNHYGPTPVAFTKVIKDMESQEELVKIKNKYFNKEQVKFLPLRDPKISTFTDEQIAHIDDVLRRYSNKNANELSEISHKDTPWLAAQPGALLDYEAVFYRTSETSVRDYSD